MTQKLSKQRYTKRKKFDHKKTDEVKLKFEDYFKRIKR